MTTTMVEAQVARAIAPLEREHITAFFITARGEDNGIVFDWNEANSNETELRLLLSAIVGLFDQLGLSQDKLTAMLGDVRSSITSVRNLSSL